MKRLVSTYRLFALLMLLLIAVPSGANASAAPFTDEVRVTIMDDLNLRSIGVTPLSGDVRILAGRNEISVRSGERIHLSRRGSEIVLEVGGKTFRGPSIQINSPLGGSFELDVPSSNHVRSYTGSLDIHVQGESGDLRVINRVPLEDYVASVVSSEYGLKDVEGARAMAVVARTYALHALQNGQTLLDSERSQVYKGLSRLTESSRQAAMSTRGQVLTFKGDLIDAVYSSSNGGRTASNETIWGSSPLPYFSSRKDPWDAKTSPHAKWEWKASEGDVHKALSKAFGMDVRDVDIISKADDGRVEEIRLKSRRDSREISGTAFRATMARSFGGTTLRSTYFDLKKRGGSYAFEGRGFGHGVGLSQWGAHGMALDGRSYDEILDFYYDGVRLEQLPSSGQALAEVELTLPSPVASSGDVSRTDASIMSIGDQSSQSSRSTSLDTVSNGNGTPKENNSTFSSDDNNASIRADEVWGTRESDTVQDASKKKKSDDKKPARKKSRRTGW